MIFRSDSMNMSRVWETTPFGGILHRNHPVIGPPAADFVENGGDALLRHQLGRKPNCCMAATWVKVPWGPKKATFIGCSSDREAEIISRKTRRMASAGKGPGLPAAAARKWPVPDREHRNRWLAALALPTSMTTSARRFSRSRI